ncbi:MAG: O-antigen ligase family protein [Pseudomonadota bacterium]|nr:O-antigen ligase family protein [Pseudomonadota bacterium]
MQKVIKYWHNLFYKKTRSEKLWSTAYILLLCVPFGMIFGKAPIDIAMTGVGLVFFLNACLEQDWDWLKIRWVPVALAIWVYYMLIAFQAIQVWVSFEGAFSFVRFVLFAVACQYWLLSHRQVRKHMVTSIELASILLVLAAWHQFFYGVDVLGNVYFENPAYFRLTAISGKLIVGGYLVMMSWPAVIKWFMYLGTPKKSFLRKLGYSVLIILWIALIPVTGERTSTIWWLLGLVLMFFLLVQFRKYFYTIGLLSIFLSISIVMNVPGLSVRMASIPGIVADAAFASLDTAYESNNGYSELNQGAIIMFYDKPWLGTGLKQYGIACTSKKLKVCTTTPQNMYLELLANTGLIGTVLFLALMLIWAQHIWHRREKLSKTDIKFDKLGIYTTKIVNDPILLGVLICLLIRIFPFVTTSSLYFSWSGITFWWMGTWLMAALEDKTIK